MQMACGYAYGVVCVCAYGMLCEYGGSVCVHMECCVHTGVVCVFIRSGVFRLTDQCVAVVAPSNGRPGRISLSVHRRCPKFAPPTGCHSPLHPLWMLQGSSPMLHRHLFCLVGTN